MHSVGQNMMRPFVRAGAGAARSLLRYVKSNASLFSLVYDLANAGEFSDLFEHEKMLADSVRVDTYAEAIRRQIRPGHVVVDLGTGSGVLAMLAARQGAKVYAIDHSDFIGVAEKIDGSIRSPDAYETEGDDRDRNRSSKKRSRRTRSGNELGDRDV